MDVSDSLLCLFSGAVERRDGSYVLEVPEREVSAGDIRQGDVYRVAILGSEAEDGSEDPVSATDRDESDTPGPPVAEEEIREVEIEDVGDKGDGIARVGPGYVVFVPGASVGDQVTVEVTTARENYAFAEVIEAGDGPGASGPRTE